MLTAKRQQAASLTDRVHLKRYADEDDLRSYEQNKRNDELPHRKPHNFGGVLCNQRSVSGIVPVEGTRTFSK